MKRWIHASTSTSAQDNIIDAVADLLDELWATEQSYKGNTILMFNRLFTPDEATAAIKECKNILNSQDLIQYVSSIKPFYSGQDEMGLNRCQRVSITLKKGVE